MMILVNGDAVSDVGGNLSDHTDFTVQFTSDQDMDFILAVASAGTWTSLGNGGQGTHHHLHHQQQFIKLCFHFQ